MAEFKFTERPGSGAVTTDPPGKTLLYTCAGIFDEEVVRNIARSYAPLTLTTSQGLLYRQNIAIDPDGHKLFRVSVPYSPRKTEDGSLSFSVSGSGGTVNVKTSLQTVATYPPDAPSHNQLVGVNKKEVAGADVIEPVGTFTLTYKHPRGYLNLSRANLLVSRIGYVNSNPWLVWNAGEVQLLNYDADQSQDDGATIKYVVSIKPNVTGLTVGGITGIAKQGHDYAWVEWEPDVDDGNPVLKPKAVRIERVAFRTDFAALLGFG